MNISEYLDRYTSNTVCATSNQHIARYDTERSFTSRIFFKITHSGKYGYSFLFEDTVSGKYRRETLPNTTVGDWQITHAVLYRSSPLPTDEDEVTALDLGTLTLAEPHTLTFRGDVGYTFNKGDVAFTDEIALDLKAGEAVCLELSVKASSFPYNAELQAPAYILSDGEWKYSLESPIPAMIGCTRKPPKLNVAYLGDSITQGCGAGIGSYKHMTALISDLIGDEYSYFNLGIGFGTADAAATDGAWLRKAKESDIVFVCFGVNDVNSGKDADTIYQSLERVVDLLTSAGARIILQTPPPFDYPEPKRAEWIKLSDMIITRLSAKAIATFDTRPILSLSPDKPEIAKYGGHPSAEGCLVWANSLYQSIRHLFP